VGRIALDADAIGRIHLSPTEASSCVQRQGRERRPSAWKEPKRPLSCTLACAAPGAHAAPVAVRKLKCARGTLRSVKPPALLEISRSPMAGRFALRLRLLFAPDAQVPSPSHSAWEVRLETVDNTAWLVVTATLPFPRCADAWVLLPQERSLLVRSRLEPVRNSPEQSMRAQVRWSRFLAYWGLTRLFREVRRERGEDPTLGEFYGFLQFPATFDWRRPSAEDQVQMRRWAAGLDDPRLQRGLYDRVCWLAGDRGGSNTVQIKYTFI
jgi:hypothetical protein